MMIENVIRKEVIPGRKDNNKLRKKVIKKRMIRVTEGEGQRQDEETTVKILALQNNPTSTGQQQKERNLQKEISHQEGRSLQFIEDLDQGITAEVETIVKIEEIVNILLTEKNLIKRVSIYKINQIRKILKKNRRMIKSMIEEMEGKMKKEMKGKMKKKMKGKMKKELKRKMNGKMKGKMKKEMKKEVKKEMKKEVKGKMTGEMEKRMEGEVKK